MNRSTCENGRVIHKKPNMSQLKSKVLRCVCGYIVHLLNINSSHARHSLCPRVVHIPCRLVCDRMEVVYLAVIHPNQLPTLSGMSFGYLQ